MMRCLTLAALAALAAGPALAQGDTVRGEALAERWCSGCHVVAENRAGGDAGPAFTSLMRGGARTEFDLRHWLFQPHPPMPDLALSDSEIEDLVAYIRGIQQ